VWKDFRPESIWKNVRNNKRKIMLIAGGSAPLLGLFARTKYIFDRPCGDPPTYQKLSK